MLFVLNYPPQAAIDGHSELVTFVPAILSFQVAFRIETNTKTDMGQLFSFHLNAQHYTYVQKGTSDCCFFSNMPKQMSI